VPVYPIYYGNFQDGTKDILSDFFTGLGGRPALPMPISATIIMERCRKSAAFSATRPGSGGVF